VARRRDLGGSEAPRPGRSGRARHPLQRLARGGAVLATGGMLPSGFSLRPAIVRWRTTAGDVELLVREVQRIGDELAAKA
jgi:hypothetical protein